MANLLEQVRRLEKKLVAKAQIKLDALSDEDLRLREDCSRSLYEFTRYAWFWIEGGKEFHGGWHLEAIAEHLEACYSGQIRNLIINQPPRTCKSTMVSVVYPAWCWIKNSSLQFLYTSYAQMLSVRDSVRCRRLIESPWYRRLWKDRFALVGDSNTKLRFDNTCNGYRLASSVGGSNTGEGGDFLICDDPNNAKESESEIVRESTNMWWDQVMSTRLNDPKTGRRIVVQQRLHECDLTGHLLAKEEKDLVHLCLPMEFESGHRCRTVALPSCTTKRWQDPRKKDGDLLWPHHMGKEEVERLKKTMGSDYIIAGQFQQRPAPAAGGIIKKDWWIWWCESRHPRCKFVVQSWDTALTKEVTSCYSACTTWGVFEDDQGIDHVMLLSLWRGRVEYPELREMATRLAKNYHDTELDDPMGGHCPPNLILIEAAANGLSLLQDLRRAGVMATRFDPRKYGSKIGRARLVTPLLECGRIWVPAKPPQYHGLRSYAELMVDSAALFPNGESNDLVDSMSQALIRLRESGWVHHREDDRPTSKPSSYVKQQVY